MVVTILYLVAVFVCLSSCAGQLTWLDEKVTPDGGQYPRIAVCVGGQVTRWQPKHLFSGLLLANPRFNFYLFYNLQIPRNNESTTKNVFTTDPQYSFDVSPMAHRSISEAARHIQSLHVTADNVRLASITYTPPPDDAYWSALFQHQPLDRIRDYAYTQTSILNMYAHQSQCIEQILDFERKHSYKFQYIINTREDAYFFKPLDLTYLISQIYHPQDDPLYASFPRIASNRTSRCDIPFKGCLNFWGFNMRFYVLRREVAIKFLSQRFEFYGQLYDMRQTVKNPEKFEYVQALSMGLRGCRIPVDRLPVTAARHVVNNEFCFILLEYFKCVPKGFENFVRDKTCLSFMRRLSSTNTVNWRDFKSNEHTTTSTSSQNIRFTTPF